VAFDLQVSSWIQGRTDAGRRGVPCPPVWRDAFGRKYLRRRGGSAYTSCVKKNAYSYWFSFWNPHTIGRGANL